MLPNRGVFMSMFIRVMAVARYRFVVELILVFVLVWCGCALLIYYFEVGINARIRTPLETIYFLLVTMTTSGDSSVVPLTLGGRLVMSFALILSKLLTALLCALAAAILIERKVKDELGLKMHTLENHIVLAGWNMKGTQIISSLRSNPRYHSTPIVIMADLEQKPCDDPFVRFSRTSFPIRGAAIERSSLASAALVLVLANYAERQNADSLTAVNCLMVRKFNHKARIVAELLDPGQRIYLEAAGADVIIAIGDIGGFLLAEAAMGGQRAQQLLDYVTATPDSAGQTTPG